LNIHCDSGAADGFQRLQTQLEICGNKVLPADFEILFSINPDFFHNIDHRLDVEWFKENLKTYFAYESYAHFISRYNKL